MNSRRVMQIFILLIFVFLFIQTKYPQKNYLTYPVSVFFKLDPLVAIGTMLSTHTFISGLFYSFLFIVAGLIFGRIFCGWFCPLGTFFDIFDRVFFIKKNRSNISLEKLSSIKYFILIFILIAGTINFQIIWFFDPISILFRSFTVAIFPAFNFFTKTLFDFFYYLGIGSFTEPSYSFLKKTVLSIKQPVYELSIFIFSFFVIILLLEFIKKRFWCKVICPLGGIFEFLDNKSMLKKYIDKNKCNECNLCYKSCKMENTDCIKCFNCTSVCPTNSISFSFNNADYENIKEINFSRRNFLISSGTAIIVLPGLKIFSLLPEKRSSLIRPPGALPEKDFLKNCVRCSQCLKVCTTNGLNPTLLEAGIYGIWSPKLVPRLGYCEHNCNLCGQVCPTGAIKPLAIEEKQKFKIGLAHFDKNRCIPWARYKDCLVCEEHCPTSKKAIKFKDFEALNLKGEKIIVKQPYVDKDLCIGCGICENKCPIKDSAIVVKKIN